MPTPEADFACEEVELRGHIIDSLMLPKVLDCDLGRWRHVSRSRTSAWGSRGTIRVTRVEIRAADTATVELILKQIADHGAVPTAAQDCRLEAADVAGAFPEGFYSTTNQRTEVRLAGHWVAVADQEMDCGIVVDAAGGTARCLPMNDVVLGERIVVGHAGVRVFPEQRPRDPHSFAFMDSSVSTEKPKGIAIREIARDLAAQRAKGGKTLLVGGPAIVHTGSGPSVQRLIRERYINVLFAGNALATHDIEQALFGTSLGVYLDRAGLAENGARASPAGHQPQCARAALPGPWPTACSPRASCTSASRVASISCWPAAFATTARCPR